MAFRRGRHSPPHPRSATPCYGVSSRPTQFSREKFPPHFLPPPPRLPPPLLTLALHVLFAICFGLIVKHAQHRNLRLLPVGAVNYLFAGAVTAAWAFQDGAAVPGAQVLGTGLFAGTVYVISYLFFIPCIREHGISISSTVVRLSQLLPVLYAILCWGEELNLWQGLGLALFCGAVPLLVNSKNSTSARVSGSRSLLTLGALLFVTGMCGVAAKRFDAIGAPGERPMFLFLLFGTTGVFSALLLIGGRAVPTRPEIELGLLLGLANVLGNYCLLCALARFGGIIVFPVASAMTIILTTLLAVTCWNEQVSPRGFSGIALASAAVVFLNL